MRLSIFPVDSSARVALSRTIPLTANTQPRETQPPVSAGETYSKRRVAYMPTVYVLNKDGKPLMSTTRCMHVRHLLKNGKELYLHKLVDHLFSNRKSPNFANTQIQQGADPLPSCLPVLILLPAIIIAATTTGKQPATPSVNGRPRK